MLSESDILNVLRSQPGVRGSEIASRLKDEKPEVNSILWKLRNRGLTRQDNAYPWFVAKKGAIPSQPQEPQGSGLRWAGCAIADYRECAYGWPYSPSRRRPFAETTLLGWAPIVGLCYFACKRKVPNPQAGHDAGTPHW